MENRELNEEKNAEIKEFLTEVFSKLIHYCDNGNLDIYTKQQLLKILFTIDQLYPSILDNYEKEINNGEK